MRLFRGVSLLLILLFLFSSGVLAKSKKLEVSFEAEEMYDSNIFYSDLNKESDFVTKLEPLIRFFRDIKRADVTIEAAPRFLFYGRNSDLNVTNYNVSENFNFRISRYVTASVSNTNIRDIVTYLTQTGAIGSTGRLEYDFNSITPSFVLSSLAGTTLVGKFTLDRFSFGSPDVDDSDGKQFSVALNQQVTKLFTALADFVYQTRHYDSGFEADVLLLDGGFSWAVTKRIRNDIRAGIQFPNQKATANEVDDSGRRFYYSNILMFVLSRSTTLSFLSQLSSTVVDVQNHVLNIWQNTVEITHSLTKRDEVKLSGSFVYADTDFVDGESVVWKTEAGWVHRINKYISLRVGVSYENADSDFSTDYSRYLTLISLNVTY